MRCPRRGDHGGSAFAHERPRALLCLADWRQRRLLAARARVQEWGGSVDSILDPEKETLVLCHHGVRSMQVSGVSICPLCRHNAPYGSIS